ncbi:hypothetical protein NFI96_017598, partial [Prochilodus magdalenae]
ADISMFSSFLPHHQFGPDPVVQGVGSAPTAKTSPDLESCVFGSGWISLRLIDEGQADIQRTPLHKTFAKQQDVPQRCVLQNVSQGLDGCMCCVQYTEDQGKKLGVNGWVKNTRQGTVIGQVQGPRDKVDEIGVMRAVVPKAPLMKTCYTPISEALKGGTGLKLMVRVEVKFFALDKPRSQIAGLKYHKPTLKCTESTQLESSTCRQLSE